MKHLSRLIEHLGWADDRCLASLQQCRTPLPAAIALYAHILGAEHTWIRRIQGVAATIPIWPEMSLDDCERESRNIMSDFRALVSSMTEADLKRPVTYRNSAGTEFTTGLEDILLHVALHGSYHRGQVAALLRSAADAPIPTDYIVWVRGAPTPARPKT